MIFGLFEQFHYINENDNWLMNTRGRHIAATSQSVTTRALARPYGHDAGKGRTKGLACWFN